MSPVLDATEIESESELQEEQQDQADAAPIQHEQAESGNIDETPEPGPVRSITLELPAACETIIALLTQCGGDGRYRSGIRITRVYETTPHEQDGEELPDSEDADQGFDTLGDAIVDAADRAEQWVSFNSDEKDEHVEHVRLALQDWLDEFEPETVTDAIFDDAEGNQILNDMRQTIDATIAADQATDATAATPATVTDDAQQHFDKRKHTLEERISQLSIEQVRLKAASKSNREAMTEYTQELTELLLRGPERLPLFDRVKPAEDVTTETPATNDYLNEIPTTDADPIAADPVATADESWRAVTVEDVGISSAVCKILRENNDIGTLGQLADWGKEYELVDLKKIGKAKAEQIQQATDDYWAEHPRS